MHPNFYHWHSRAELKPDTAILEPRWNAAAKFAEKLSSGDVRSLIRLVLFSGAEPDFAKKFTEALVKAEPTFPITNNAELLRVMAAAAAYTRFEKPSNEADALATGLQAACFPEDRAEPVCQDIINGALEYLDQERERVRPAIDAGALEKSEKQVEAQLTAFKKQVDANNTPEMWKGTEAIGRSLFATMKESHERLGEVIRRLTEESQYLWWLIGHRSQLLKKRRDQITVEDYALPAAAEAASRVTALPPSASVESLLDEVLTQCAKDSNKATSLVDFIQSTDVSWIQLNGTDSGIQDLTPIASLLMERKQGLKPDAGSLKKLNMPSSTKVTPKEIARQYFRELVFLRALAELS